MKARILRYLKHIFLTLAVILPCLILFGLSQGATANYGTQQYFMDWHNDGPYVFYETDSTVSIHHVQGNRDDGFELKTETHSLIGAPIASTFYNPDSSQFEVSLAAQFTTPPAVYNDGSSILAISDIEGNYRAFRDFLIHHSVIDTNLKWTFGNGHLVLPGDFVDRGAYVTQVLWFIHYLEQAARQHGGQVHFIIGNHELKAMHGNTGSASEKYTYIASFLNRQQHDLTGPDSYIGRWLESKNALERINGHLFVHGGIHPDFAESELSIGEVNTIIRSGYRRAYFPRAEGDEHELLHSGRTGPCWYRGYFKENLEQEQVTAALDKFGAKDVIVGHTLQHRVKTHFEGKVIAIDVKHPSDHEMNWPHGASEGLLIEGADYYRLREDGSRKALK
ncbi:hypothetical protein FUA23_15060 [Neolewinella aurantiaca]|uniref:Calcineurin-like phosphoesterase domain-containing protein n=1 Tax=Neolewinella aurantiaca TaxID=2602767 RepID=A0A5C7FCB3_9BACT|nr:metallophosphoesterase [Neolewinella aurantiaca]TXF88297.1 hypothetical protein FUA23_15060 [Neolewinella aurantiaca]